MLCLLSTLALAAMPPGPPPPPDFGMESVDDEEIARNFDQVAESIGLDGAQKEKLRDAFYDAHMKRIDIKARQDKAELELKQLMRADTLDEKAVRKALETALAAEAELKRNRVDLLIVCRRTITADQWAQLESMRSERRSERRENWRDRRGPPPNPPTTPAVPAE